MVYHLMTEGLTAVQQFIAALIIIQDIFTVNVCGIGMTVTRYMIYPQVTIIAVYRSPKISVIQLCSILTDCLNLFYVNWLSEMERTPFYNLFVRDNNYRQLITCYTTDNKSCIDHIYTNLSEKQVKVHVLETYFLDHKCICALINCFDN